LTSSDTIQALLPEAILVLAATAIYVVGAFVRSRAVWSWVGAAAVIAAGAVLALQAADDRVTGPVVADQFAGFLRWLALAVGLLFVLLTARPAAAGPAPEVVGSLLMAVAGLMLSASAGDLVLLFVGLELVSIPTYVLLYLGRRDAPAQEAAVKYFYLSILSSAVLLYGFSFLYGVAGATDLAAVRAAVGTQAAAASGGLTLATLALVMVFAGLGFKIAAAPFHFYAPDVYHGTTHSNAGLLAVFPKVAGLAALVRLALVAMPGLEGYGWRITLIVAALTMTVGNVLALWQDQVRRLLAYSSIAHAGYLLVGLAVAYATAGDPVAVAAFDGVGAMLFYLAAYALATVGAFAALVYLEGDGGDVSSLDHLAGIGRTRPIAGLALAVALFSLAGMPPLAGFWGKLALFAGALSVEADETPASDLKLWFVGLAVIGVVNAAIAAGYYLRMIAAIYFRPAGAPPPASGGRGAWTAMVACAVLLIGFGSFPGRLARDANLASQSLGRSAANAEAASAGELLREGQATASTARP
jgi:NADH-quinone oxidoreductase subunit N